MDVLERIDQQVKGNAVVIFMKGTPQFPQCGFSMRAAAALKECGVPFAHVNVLQDMEIFENLPRYADWPTFPQIYIDGELVGGGAISPWNSMPRVNSSPWRSRPRPRPRPDLIGGGKRPGRPGGRVAIL
jgi:monothiol glutaredoxin